MNCDCIRDVERRMAEHYQKELGCHQVEVSCQNYGIGIIDLSLVGLHLTNFKVTAPVKGYTKGKVMPVYAKYCPICGKSVKKAPEYKGKATANFPCGSMGEEVPA